MLNKLQVGPARSVAMSQDGEMIAVGLKNGGFIIMNAETFKVLGQRRDRGQMINDIRYVLAGVSSFCVKVCQLLLVAKCLSSSIFNISKGINMERWYM